MAISEDICADTDQSTRDQWYGADNWCTSSFPLVPNHPAVEYYHGIHAVSNIFATHMTQEKKVDGQKTERVEAPLLLLFF